MTDPTDSITAYAQQYLDRTEQLARTFAKPENLASLEALVGKVEEVRRAGGTIYFCGNGGSASTAEHVATDLFNNTAKGDDGRILTHSLSSNLPSITALGNDFGYGDVFKRQLEGRLSDKDMLVAISASGNSPNVVFALDYANGMGVYTVAVVGFETGGKAKEIADLAIHIKTEKGEYEHVEDMHMIVGHVLIGYFKQVLGGNPH